MTAHRGPVPPHTWAPARLRAAALCTEEQAHAPPPPGAACWQCGGITRHPGWPRMSLHRTTNEVRLGAHGLVPHPALLRAVGRTAAGAGPLRNRLRPGAQVLRTSTQTLFLQDDWPRPGRAPFQRLCPGVRTRGGAGPLGPGWQLRGHSYPLPWPLPCAGRWQGWATPH